MSGKAPDRLATNQTFGNRSNFEKPVSSIIFSYIRYAMDDSHISNILRHFIVRHLHVQASKLIANRKKTAHSAGAKLFL